MSQLKYRNMNHTFPRYRYNVTKTAFALSCIGALIFTFWSTASTTCPTCADDPGPVAATTNTEPLSSPPQTDVASVPDRAAAELPLNATEGVAAPVVVKVDLKKPSGKSDLAVGVTHTQYSLDSWGDPRAVARGKALLRHAVEYQNQHIMGFGSLNPEPTPGVYDWKRLDERVQLMRETGSIPTITLCCAPDWMKGGKPGTTDWSKLEVAPLPEYYDDFAELARQVARRYPDVKHFIVWNEMKGFWDTENNNWNYVEYTKLYNKVYDALKSVDSKIQVGGPYLVIEGTGTNSSNLWASQKPITKRNREVLEYWLKNKRGADFLAVDRSVKTAQDSTEYTESEYLALTAVFQDVTRQLKAMTNLPIWWVESYFTGTGNNPDYEAVGLASMLYNQLIAGASVSMRWAPQAQPNESISQNLFTSSLAAGGAQPLPAYYVYKAFYDYFGPGTRLYATSSSSKDVEVLASAEKVLLINKRPTPVKVRLNNRLISLKGYEVRLQ